MICTMKLRAFWVCCATGMFMLLTINLVLEYPKEERSRNVKQMLREKLPIENYELFKYLIEFLVKVSILKNVWLP